MKGTVQGAAATAVEIVALAMLLLSCTECMSNSWRLNFPAPDRRPPYFCLVDEYSVFMSPSSNHPPRVFARGEEEEDVLGEDVLAVDERESVGTMGLPFPPR